MACVSAYLCIRCLLCVNAVTKEEREEGALLAGGSKSNEKFSWLTQETLNLLQFRKLLNLIGLKGRLGKRDI